MWWMVLNLVLLDRTTSLNLMQFKFTNICLVLVYYSKAQMITERPDETKRTAKWRAVTTAKETIGLDTMGSTTVERQASETSRLRKTMPFCTFCSVILNSADC